MKKYTLLSLVFLVGCNEPQYPELLVVRTGQGLSFGDPRGDCAECHPTHVDEWEISNHAYSGNDPVFVAMVKVAQAQSMGKVGQFCTQCHTPVAAFTQQTPVYFDEQTRRFRQNVTNIDEKARQGVSCDVCHSITNIIETRNARLELTPDGVQRSTIEDPVPNTFHESVYSPLHSESLVCSSCHTVTSAKGALIEQTFTEWSYSRYPTEGKECQTCHMPEYQGQAAKDGPERTLHRHNFVGVDVSLLAPDQYPGYWEMRELTTALLQESAEMQVHFDPGETKLKMRIENLAGHALPSGSIADRQMWIQATIRNIEGNLVFESGTLDSRGDLRDGVSSHNEMPGTDPQLIFYGQLPLRVPELVTETDPARKTAIRARIGASCMSIGLGGIPPDAGATPVMFPWQSTWQCDYLIPPHGVEDRAFDLNALDSGTYEADIKLLYRTFPPFVLRRLEVLGDLDPAVKTRVPTVTMEHQTFSFDIPLD